jgi:2-polyprenyl-3-methyl-5-hydroxy-6-metoxy-1,4-benzoquinol methylase
MATSDPSNISLIVEIVTKMPEPKSILDIGVGCGKYGLLFREYLDGTWKNRAFHAQSTWQINIVALEVFRDYITPVHEYIYDKIIIDDAYKYLCLSASTHPFDLVFMGDVIEHFTKEEGLKLIETIRDKWLSPHGRILISTPNFQTRINDPKRAFYGNTHEIHKCRWYPQDFANLKMKARIIEGKLLTVELVK